MLKCNDLLVRKTETYDLGKVSTALIAMIL